MKMDTELGPLALRNAFLLDFGSRPDFSAASSITLVQGWPTSHDRLATHTQPNPSLYSRTCFFRLHHLCFKLVGPEVAQCGIVPVAVIKLDVLNDGGLGLMVCQKNFTMRPFSLQGANKLFCHSIISTIR